MTDERHDDEKVPEIFTALVLCSQCLFYLILEIYFMLVAWHMLF